MKARKLKLILLPFNSYPPTSPSTLYTNDRGGNAGNINLNIADDIILNNGNPPNKSPFSEQILQDIKLETGIFANNFPDSTGNGVRLVLLTLLQRALPQITDSSQQ